MTRRMSVVPVVLGLLVGFYLLTLPETPDTATTTDTAVITATELESSRQRIELGDAEGDVLGDDDGLSLGDRDGEKLAAKPRTA